LKKFFCLWAVLLLAGIAIHAQQVKNQVGAPYAGLSAYSRLHKDAFAMNNNQAALAGIKDAAIGILGERRFLLSELGSYTMAVALPVKPGAFGVQASRFGFSGFNETEAGLGYGMPLGNRLSVGARINYYSQQVSGYGNASTLNFETGLMVHLTPKLEAGLHTYNPVGGKFGADKTEKLASLYRFGLGYDASEKLFLAAELIKEEEQPVNAVAAVHYYFDDRFFARLGISSAATNVFAAAGLSLAKHFRLEVFTSHHQQLGFTPGLLLHYSFKK
jgi:hypothetical protein